VNNHSPLVIPSVGEGSAVRLATTQKSRGSSGGTCRFHRLALWLVGSLPYAKAAAPIDNARAM